MRKRCLAGATVCGALIALLGCASAKQIQYFAVTYRDPKTGETNRNYYRLTVDGGTFGPVSYQLKAAYLNSATVDVLQGKGVFIPEADLPIEQDEVFDEVLQTYYSTIKQRAELAGKVATDTSRESLSREDSLLQVARQVWLASLSTGDVTSVGQVQSLDPREFRKLVFYATAKNIDLEQTIGPQIDAMIKHVTTLARYEKQRAKARKKRKGAIGNLIRNLPGVDPATKPFLDMAATALEGGTAGDDSDAGGGQ